MNKTEFITKIHEATSVSKKDVKEVIDILPKIIKEAVVADDKLALTGFITFEKKHVNAKSGTSRMNGVENPWTTEPKDIINAKLSKSYKEL